jgi:hypothetical protein
VPRWSRATGAGTGGVEPKPLAIHGIYQSREYQPAALRAFLDELPLSGMSAAFAVDYFAFSQERPCSRK